MENGGYLYIYIYLKNVFDEYYIYYIYYIYKRDIDEYWLGLTNS